MMDHGSENIEHLAIARQWLHDFLLFGVKFIILQWLNPWRCQPHFPCSPSFFCPRIISDQTKKAYFQCVRKPGEKFTARRLHPPARAAARLKIRHNAVVPARMFRLTILLPNTRIYMVFISSAHIHPALTHPGYYASRTKYRG
jgi:hypothetical protein